MKIVISQIELTNLFSKILSVVPAKPAIPVISNVLVEALDDQIILTATDLTTTMQCFLEAKIIETGSIALPAKKFFYLIKELTANQIKISNENNIANIISGSSLFKINGLPKTGFPTIETSSKNYQILFKSSLLKEMLSKTSFSAARNDQRSELNGVHLKISDQTVTFLGTDGKRLAKISKKIDMETFFQGSYNIPIKAVEEMIKTLDNEEKAKMIFTEDKIILECGNLIISTKLLSGVYPNFENVIPQNSPYEIIIHKEEISSLLKQTALFTTEEHSSIRFIFNKGELNLVANSQTVGEGMVGMPIDYNAEKISISFNPFFFLDILRHTKDEAVKLGIKDAYNPGVITDSSNAVFVIMPMRLQEEEKQIDDPQEASFI